MVFEEDFRWWRPSQDPDSDDEYERETLPPWKHTKDKPVSLPPPQKGSEDDKGGAKGGGKKESLLENRASGMEAWTVDTPRSTTARIGGSSGKWRMRSASRISRTGTT